MNTNTESPRAGGAIVQSILSGLQDRIGPQKFSVWFRNGVTFHVEDGHVNVAVPNPFVGNWIEGHYQDTIAEVAEAKTGRKQAVTVTIDPALSGTVRQRQLDKQAEMVDKATSGRARSRRPARTAQLRYKLKDFVVGESNKLAYSAALAVVGPEPAPFNPLFVHGPCGVGKTHLLQGICEAASRRTTADGRAILARYVTAEQFTNEFIAAIRQKKTGEFHEAFRKLDLLAIDDVHFLAAKKATQDEFLHTFNAIDSGGRQVVMASDAHPRMVGDMNEALVNRFMAGMVVKIDSPDRQMRLEILRRRAGQMRLNASPEVLEYIAAHIRGSVRELEGTLVKLAAVAALGNGQVTLELAREALAEHLARTDSAVTLGDIEAAVSAYFGITPPDVHSSRRTRTVSLARMVCMFLARRHTRMSYPEIGRFMGKNHSSVVLAVQRMEAVLAEDGELEWMAPAGPKSMKAKKLLELLNEQIT